MINKSSFYNYKKLLTYSLLLLISTPTFAVIGLPDKTARYGVALDVSKVDVTDPDGSNPDKETMIPLTLIVTDWLAFGNRYWLEYTNGKTSGTSE